MARTRGSYNFSQNFEVFRTAPLDARQKVEFWTDLIDPSTWVDGDGYVWLYKGALVVVTEDPSAGLYWLNDAPNYTSYSSWLPIAAVDDISTGSTGRYNTTLDPSLEMPQDVGGIPAGTAVSDLKGDTYTQLFDDLLFPTAEPTLTGPSGAFAMSPTTTLYEVGDTATLTFTTTLNRGSINPQYTADSPFRSGPPNGYDFTGTGLVDVSTSSNPYVHPAIDVSILQGNQSWSAQIAYDEGVQPYDNKGNPYDSSLAAGTLSASPTRTIEGVYPIFACSHQLLPPRLPQMN
jgi:hypothetical protein